MYIPVDQSTPRDCTRRNPCQQDTSIIRAREVRSGRASPCGRTILNGSVNIQSETQKQMQAGGGFLPSLSANGEVQMTIHQINADGGGPYSCDVDPTGTGENFQAMTVTQNVPGILGNSLRTQLTDHPVTAKIPTGMKCTGGANGNMCLVRCKNQAIAGPFGSCMAVQQDDGTAANSSGAGAQKAAATKSSTKSNTKNSANQQARDGFFSKFIGN
ncbi:hypothetical protein HK098_001362 [Nowakowskiella sp. JEL0407]|nr:hypothetical protein HK098_001362 [Nowakowskiella sp. JEL0407]